MPGTGKNGTPAGAWSEELAAFVVAQLWAGQDLHQVVRGLEDRGLEHATAISFVEAVEEKLRRGGAL